MIKDSLNSLGAYIRLLILLVILNNDSLAQILPSSFGVHHKKSSSVSDESFVLDFNNNDDCTGTCSTSFYAEVPWSENLSTYSVSMWVKSGEANPSNWRAFFNSHTPNSGGFQLDSNGSNAYRFLSTEGSQTFGANTIKTTWVHVAAVVNGTDTKFRLPSEAAFFTAPITSPAFPTPTPTSPFSLPITKIALKLNFFPPFTTLVTLLIWTTLSCQSGSLSFDLLDFLGFDMIYILFV